ncbi:MAG: hypothetical protein IKU60_03200 [Clostridia bacterium]|nr:hypothetical protein [Clostridia bacterium]
METFGERLTRMMKEAGLKDENMAFLLDVNIQRLENLTSGYCSADIDLIKRVAEIFGVSQAYAAAVSDDKEVREGDVKEILVAEKLHPGEVIMRSEDVRYSIYIDKNITHGKDYIGYIMPDDSMVKARLVKGDTLVVRRQMFAENSNVVVVILENGTTVVRRYNRIGNIVTLTCEGDAMKYPPIKIDTTLTKIAIVGRVCECRINL